MVCRGLGGVLRESNEASHCGNNSQVNTSTAKLYNLKPALFAEMSSFDNAHTWEVFGLVDDRRLHQNLQGNIIRSKLNLREVLSHQLHF